MVIALPRSGTAWAANWLTTDRTICLHDPLFTCHYKDWDKLQYGPRKVGVACTGIVNFPEWVNDHPARKVVLHRPLEQINDSLRDRALDYILKEELEKRLYDIEGKHQKWKDLFNPRLAKGIYEFLLNEEFDPERHAQLVTLNVQRDIENIKPNKRVTNRLIKELNKGE